ncbi:MAG: PaaI family thioesterase [Thermoplasmata archaeon]|nr:PaaI family thioesterase [Thermoplasmata archaeon]
MDRDAILARMSDDAKPYIDAIVDMYEAPFARYIGIEIESLEKDRAVCSLELRPELMNSMGRGHGGAVYALIDHTFAIACNMSHPSTGQSNNVVFYRPASGKLTAVCVPINRSRSLEMYDVRVLNGEGKLVASSTCTAFVLRSE